MIAVAIVSVLASVAVVGFKQYRESAIRSEAPPIVAAIAKSQIAFYQTPRTNGTVELDPCFLRLPEMPSWARYVAGQFEFPTPFATGMDLTYDTSFDYAWTLVGLPTGGNVHHYYTSIGVSTDLTGPQNLPICIAYEAGGVLPLRLDRVLYVFGAADLNNDFGVDAFYVVEYRINENGDLYRAGEWLNNPF